MSDKREALNPDVVRIDGGTQMRLGLNQIIVNEYAEAMVLGAQFPEIVVYFDGKDYWLGDGFHRLEAHKRASTEEPIRAEVRSGTRRDAVLHAAGSNANHGLRRTNADKRRAVETLLRDDEWVTWSDREIARRCGVHHEMVGRMRAELSGGFRQMDGETEASKRMVHRNGQTYTQNVTKISSANQERKSVAQPAPDPLANDMRIQAMDKLADELRALTKRPVEPTPDDAADDTLDMDSIDQRLFDAKLIIAGINRMLDKDLPRYEELTGKMFDTPPVRRNLHPMKAELLKLIEVLEQC